MRLKSVAKLGVIVSLSLFCIAAGLYMLWGLNNNKETQEFNLYSLVPEDAICVVESDNINYYFNEISHLSCAEKFDSIETLDLAKYVLGTLNDYSSQVGHGLNSYMGHILISVHDTDTIDNQVLYIYSDENGSNEMDNMLNEIFGAAQSPNMEKYKGKKIYQYKINATRALSMYKDDGFRIVSFNINLIKDVIKGQKESKSLWNNEQFKKTREKNITHNFLTLYCKESLMSYLDSHKEVWSAYNFKINSDVIYLTGNTSFTEAGLESNDIEHKLVNVPEVDQDSIILTSNIKSMRDNIDEIYAKRSRGENTLFDECVANVSQDASFMMVVDGEKLKTIKNECKPYIIPFILNNKEDFSDFILSAQLSLSQNNLMHVIILTYKG